MYNIVLILLLLATIVGCAKPDPNPELRDPIFTDITSQIASLNQQIESEKNQLKKHEQELAEAPPQTGKVKFALKRVSESKSLIASLDQERKYLEIKIESRKKAARSSYLQAFKEKRPWPEPREWDLYISEKRLRQAKKNWDVKQRIKEHMAEDLSNEEKTTGGH